MAIGRCALCGTEVEAVFVGRVPRCAECGGRLEGVDPAAFPPEPVVAPAARTAVPAYTSTTTTTPWQSPGGGTAPASAPAGRAPARAVTPGWEPPPARARRSKRWILWLIGVPVVLVVALIAAGLVLVAKDDERAAERLEAFVADVEHHTYTAPDGAFTAEFPAPPSASVQATEAAVGAPSVDIHLVTARAGRDHVFEVVFLDIEPGIEFEPGVLLDNLAASAVSDLDGRLLWTQDAAHGTFSARDLAIRHEDAATGRDFTSRCRYVVTDTRVYGIVLTAVDEEPEVFDRFVRGVSIQR